MAAKKKPATKKSVKKSATKKAPAKKAPTKKASAKKAPATKAPAKKAPAKSAAPKNAGKKEAPMKQASKKASVQKEPKSGDATSPLLGKMAPAFELQDQSGNVVSSASLKGKPYVLYFYPKDNTPGCTQESCDFRDEERNFRAAGVTILGVSPDSVKSHAGFASKFELPFPLLSDPEKQLAQAYGVWALKKNYGKEYWGIVRSTFFVDKNGKVASEWRQVKVKGHAAAVLGEAKK